MSGRHDTPFSELLPDDLTLTLSGPAALAVASREAATLAGLDIDRPTLRQRAWIAMPWAAVAAAVLVTVALAAGVTALTVGAVGDLRSEQRQQHDTQSPVPKEPAGDPPAAPVAADKIGEVGRKVASAVTTLVGIMMPFALLYAIVRTLAGIARGEDRVTAAGKAAAPALQLLMLVVTTQALSVLLVELSGKMGLGDPGAGGDSGGSGVTLGAAGPYVLAVVVGLATLAAGVTGNGWLICRVRRLCAARAVGVLDAQLEGVQPIVRGRVSAREAGDDSVGIDVDLLVPRLAGDRRHFDYDPRRVESVVFPAWAVEQAKEHATERRVHIEALLTDAEAACAEERATLAAAREAREQAALASTHDDAGVLVALINDGNEDKRPGAFT